MTTTENMRRIVALKDKLSPATLRGLHTLGREFMGMINMFVEFSNSSTLYIETDDTNIPTATMVPGKTFISENSYEMMNAMFINPDDMRNVLSLEDSILLESFSYFLDDPYLNRVQMVIDKNHEFLNYLGQDAILFKNMVILKR